MNLNNKKILSLCAGGVRGIAHLGVIKYLEDNNIFNNIDTYAGSSIGAIICALLNIGYTSNELYEFAINLDFTKLFHIDNIELLISQFGFDKGTRIDYIIKNLITAKKFDPNITLKELYEHTKKKLIIVTTCLTTNSEIYLDYINYPDLPLKLAIRMSACVPLLMIPIKYDNKLYIDGGCTVPLIYNIFKGYEDTVIAINLSFNNNNNKINNLEDYIYETFKVIHNSFSTNIIKQHKDIININVDIFFIDISLSNDEKKIMFDIGYNKIKELFTLVA